MAMPLLITAEARQDSHMGVLVTRSRKFVSFRLATKSLIELIYFFLGAPAIIAPVNFLYFSQWLSFRAPN